VQRKLALAIVFLGSVTAGFGWTWYRFLTVPVRIAKPVVVVVEPGESASKIARRLANAGVIRNARGLLLLARLRSADREFRHGEHRFEGLLLPDDVLAELVSHTVGTRRMTIPEGRTLREIARMLEESGIVDAVAYRSAACDPGIVALAGASPDGHCAEGFLFPDTYDFAPTATAEEIVRMQIARFQSVARRVLGELPAGLHNAIVPRPANGIAFGGVRVDEPAHTDILRAAVTLASIIEKETGVDSERALVGSVFHNRIRRGMRLQADPTVVYGLELAGIDWNRGKLHEYLRQPGPYNTYTEHGLPPGPICNPGELALRAALMPEQSEFFYFVANADGTHRFSRTLAEHNRAVADARRRARHAS
jgi:UPF0755 protein